MSVVLLTLGKYDTYWKKYSEILKLNLPKLRHALIVDQTEYFTAQKINKSNYERKQGCSDLYEKMYAVAGDRTRVTRVTGGNTYHYTTTTC